MVTNKITNTVSKSNLKTGTKTPSNSSNKKFRFDNITTSISIATVDKHMKTKKSSGSDNESDKENYHNLKRTKMDDNDNYLDSFDNSAFSPQADGRKRADDDYNDNDDNGNGVLNDDDDEDCQQLLKLKFCKGADDDDNDNDNKDNNDDDDDKSDDDDDDDEDCDYQQTAVTQSTISNGPNAVITDSSKKQRLAELKFGEVMRPLILSSFIKAVFHECCKKKQKKASVELHFHDMSKVTINFHYFILLNINCSY